MSIHSFVDVKSLKFAAAASKNTRYFNRGTSSRRLIELPDVSAIRIPEITGKGLYEAEGEIGGVKIRPAVFVKRWYSDNVPLIIYHHGAAEGGYDFSFNRIFNNRMMNELHCNIMAIRGPFSGTNKEFIEKIKNMDNYTAIIAGSASLIEAVIRQYRRRSDSKVIITGTSLGGVVACLHKLAFNSADAWLPLYAGPDVGNVFIDSAYSVMSAADAKTAHADEVKRILNFGTEFSGQNNNEQVFPLLGKYDMIFNLDEQRKYFIDGNLSITGKGHSTGASSSAELREHIMKIVRKLSV